MLIALTASDTKSELKAAVWQIPNNADPFNPASDDSSNSHPHLQLKCYLSPDEHSDVKR